MATTSDQIAQAIQVGELQVFGFAMPRLSPDWSPQNASGVSFTVDDASMTITASQNWAAPLDMGFQIIDPDHAAPMPVTLIKPDGSVEHDAGVLLTLFDQPWRRLERLYAQLLETTTSDRPEQRRGLPVRPSPRYIFFPTQTMLFKSGLAEAWADLGFSGAARFYDGDGLPIDPVGVMAAFAAILKKFPVLQAVDLGSNPLDPLPLAQHLSTLAPSTKTRIRFAGADGKAYGGQHLTGVTVTAAASGLFELSGASVGLDAVSATFTQDDHDRLVFGPATSGRLTSSFTPPTLPSGVTLARDFYSLRVVPLKQYLIGDWPDPLLDEAVKVQRKPAVRINENVTFLADGNDVLGAISQALPPSGANPSLAVAQAIDGAFSIPPGTGDNAHWPKFPAGVTVDANATLSTALKAQVQNGLQANWVTGDPNDFKKADVVLQLQGLPAQAWVRIYTRKFLPDALQGRGDGQGRLVPTDGTLSVTLADPFSLRDPKNPSPGDVIVPPKATLMFDLAAVLPNGKTRIYGGLSVAVGDPPAPSVTFDSGTNPCGTATFRGVSNAGILGLGTPSPAQPPASLADWAKLLSGETQPRDASRLPTMARRELLVAGLQSNLWSGVIGGGRIARETVSAATRVGAPASLGGRETAVTGTSTHGGILAYDVARHAFRRSKDIVTRLTELVDTQWNVPAAPTAVGIGQNPGANNGTMAGAVLQTIAPFCETPELFAAWSGGVNINTAIQFVIDHFIPASLPLRSQVVTALQGLQTSPAPPEPAKEDSTEQRLAVELEREITSVFYGRRDAQWALKSALQTARHLVYIETPGFCTTSAAIFAEYAADLIGLLKNQLGTRPGLRLILCVPKVPDFATGYEGMSAYEVADRFSLVKGRTGTSPVTPLPPAQTVLFHPIGFPGRFSRIETNVVIVDDAWAMIGGSTIRRRGLTFDGSSDLVVTDTLLENGRSAAIRDFRRRILADRLGVQPDSSQPSFVALGEGSTAFNFVRDVIAAGGLGDVSPVWDGTTPGVDPVTPLTVDQANPEGREFDLATAAIIAALGAASGV
jgi:hypothetical protein